MFVNKEIIKSHIYCQHDVGRFEGIHCAKIVPGKVKPQLHKLRLHDERGCQAFSGGGQC